MSATDGTNVLIGGKVYTLAGQESEEYIQKVALYINHKLSELNQTENSKKLNTRLQSVLLQLNIADDYFKEKQKNESLQRSLEEKDAQIMEINEKMIEEDRKVDAIKEEALEERIQLEKKIEELKKQVDDYKAELDEYIEIFDQG